ncbi:MAG TPA: RNA methyltransferase [Bacteroidia bacterium]
MDKELVEYLSNFITEHKWNLFQDKIQDRTRHLTVVVENLFQEHNISAVLRTADCFGLQDVHVIERGYSYKVNDEIALGASKWLDVKHYKGGENNTLDCYKALRDKGYKIVATTPHKDDVNLEEYDFSQKTALVFGTEKEGLSEEAIEQADAWLKVPMVGFTESLNISVCAAICMHHATWKLRSSGNFPHLSEDEKLEILYRWVKQVIKKPELIENEFWKNKGIEIK